MNKGVIWYVPTIYSILYLLPFTWKLTADFYFAPPYPIVVESVITWLVISPTSVVSRVTGRVLTTGRTVIEFFY